MALSKLKAKRMAYHPHTREIYEVKGSLVDYRERGFEIFDSGLELKTYLYLLKIAKHYVIQRQAKAVLLPKCSIDKEITWKVDFRIGSILDLDLLTNSNLKTLDVPIYVESKGYETADYLLKHRLFLRANLGHLIVIRHERECDKVASLLADLTFDS